MFKPESIENLMLHSPRHQDGEEQEYEMVEVGIENLDRKQEEESKQIRPETDAERQKKALMRKKTLMQMA